MVGEGYCWGRKEQKTEKSSYFPEPSGDDSKRSVAIWSSYIGAWKECMMSTRSMVGRLAWVQSVTLVSGAAYLICRRHVIWPLRALEGNPWAPWSWAALIVARSVPGSPYPFTHDPLDYFHPFFAFALVPEQRGIFRVIWEQDEAHILAKLQIVRLSQTAKLRGLRYQ